MIAKLNSPTPDLSVILVSYNTAAMTCDCIADVKQKLGSVTAEILVVDNASSDGSADRIRTDHPDVRLIESRENLGFAGGNNLALNVATGKFLLLLNTDAFVFPDTIPLVLEEMKKRPKTGIAGVRLVTPSGDPQPSARYKPSWIRKMLVMTGLAGKLSGNRFSLGYDYPASLVSSPAVVDWVPGAFFMIRREVADQIGLLDDGYFMYFEEVDYCLRALQAGWDTLYIPHASAIHLGGISSKQTSMKVSVSGSQLIPIRIASEYRFYSRYGSRWKARFNLRTEVWLRSLIAWRQQRKQSVSSLRAADGERYTAREITLFLRQTRCVS